MAKITLRTQLETLRLAQPFHISGYVFRDQEVVVATVEDGTYRGRGEASGVYYLGDTAPAMRSVIEGIRQEIEGGADRKALQALLPPGGARNAIDCAMWELEANRAGTTAWALAGITTPKPLVTTFTLGADTPETMAAGAKKYAQARAIKIKLTGELALDIARVTAIRAARAEVWIGVDANQGYTIDALPALIDALTAQRVSLLEQPLKRGREADLDGFKSKIPLAADESALSLKDLAGLVKRFDIVNIKLDKCGGLTEAMAMAHEARRLGLGVMVGNMVGSSLAMAPAFVVGQLCDVVDLDGPIFLAQDRSPGVIYAEGTVWSPEAVWGGAKAERH
jgi:L-alanine-DL-glutamate epimerase-like enolase superfamily enzyme